MALEVGNGTSVRFRQDRCCGSRSLKEVYPELYLSIFDKDALVGLVLISDLDVRGRSWNLQFLRGFHDWELESVNSVLDFIYSKIPWGEGCDKMRWLLIGNGVFNVCSYSMIFSYDVDDYTPLFKVTCLRKKPCTTST